MLHELKYHRRKSYLEIGEIFFWTATINSWKYLLHNDKYKNVITNSLQYLTDKGKIDVFAFVVMPNHIHLIWQIQDGYKPDKIQLRFQKYTAQQMKV